MRKAAALLAMALCASGLVACGHVSDLAATQVQRPARGSVDLIYDKNAGAYVVIGRPDYYWYRDHYYRWSDGRWMASVKLDGEWADCSPRVLPPGLVRKYARAGGPPLPASPRR
jgi:hypothetical protein